MSDGRVPPNFRLQLIERTVLFRGVEAGACREFARLARDRRVVRRESFYLQGDPAEDVFVACAGWLKITQVGASGEQVILRLVGPGEAFGLVALESSSGDVYPSAAEALESSHALVWDRYAFNALAERNPIILRNALKVLSAHLRSLERGCLELSTVRAPSRVAETLLRLAGRMGRPTNGGALLSLGRGDLAQMTGTTSFTVSRLLADWQERGYVRTGREVVVLLDAAGLARHVASGDCGPEFASV